MKNKLRYLRYRNLHSELARYGYEYTPRKALYGYALLVLVAAVVGFLYKLEIPGVIAIILFGVLYLPSMMLQTMKGRYHTGMFSLANNYMEQFLYSFERTETVLSALREVANVFDNQAFEEVVNKAIDHILYSTDSEDTEKEALDMIGDFFNCDKVDTIHAFVLGAQRRGGDPSSSIALLERNRSMWVSRICNLQKEFQVVKRNILFALVATLLICLLPLYLLGANLDISTMLFCQISAVVMIGLCIVIYVKADKRLCRSWIEKKPDNTRIEEKYLEVENYDEEAELKTSMKMAIAPIIITAILFIWKQHMGILLAGIVVVVFLLNQHKIGHHLAKKKVAREIEKQFPEWLMQVALLLQTDNVQIAIRKSLEDAPNVLRPALMELIIELEIEPDSLIPYNRFLRRYQNPDVQSAMQMLYALSVGNFINIGAQIDELIERNNTMMDKAEQLHQEDLVAGMKVYILLPSLLASFKLMIDMSLLLVLFLQNLQF
ncbi:MAG: hypothetical protein IKL07_03060 [Clostridium sp.]|nr:hypothetical protein [Clostridium sp.]